MTHVGTLSYPYRIPFDFVPMSYSEALDHLAHILRLGICPMLETVEEMLDELGRPDAYFDIVQIAGTNGKTSTSRYTAAVLGGEGLRCGLYTSPELVSYTERMEVDGAPIVPDAFGLSIAAAVEAGRRVNSRRIIRDLRPYDVTEFDTLTVAACVAFALAEIDVAVLEVGLGGRWDATTATHPQVSAVTGIGLDHTHILGDTLGQIAAEKAAIIKAGQSCVLGTGTQTPEVAQVLLGRCKEQGVVPQLVRQLTSDAWDRFVETGQQPDQSACLEAVALPEASTPSATPSDQPSLPNEAVRLEKALLPQEAALPKGYFTIRQEPASLADALVFDLVTPRSTYRDLAAQKPYYQAQNIACAALVAENYLGRPLRPEGLAASVARCPTPGRFDVLRSDPLLLVDAAHNPQSIAVFLDGLRRLAPQVEDRPALLCAVLADKDCSGIARLLGSEFPQVYVCQTSSPRAREASKLADLFLEAGAPVAGVYSSVAQALEATRGTALVATGSITLAGEVAALLGRK